MQTDETIETVDCALEGTYEGTYLSDTMIDSISKRYSGCKVLDARTIFLNQASKWCRIDNSRW